MKKIFLLMALCCMLVFCAKADEAYVVFDGNHTLTYYYDDKRASWENDGYITEVYSDWYTPFHEGYNDKVELIVVDESMKNANLNRMEFLFGGPNGEDTYLSALTTIYGMENLNTANVTDMSGMFYGCESLTDIDLYAFNTANVTDMSSMFEGCKSLTSIDVSAFNTANVTAMSRMFMSCISLKDIDVSGFNTANVTNMNSMFYECSSLTSLDVTNFKMDKVGNAGSMFSQCSALQTIYCNDDWSQNEVLEASEYMFTDCSSLVGGKGSAYSYGNWDISYARPDGGAEAPGYFTRKKEVYTVFDGNETLTYYYDDQAAEREGIVEKYLVRKTQVRFDGYNKKVKKAVIDESMNEADIDWMGGLFYGGNNTHALTNMTDIEGLENLNTSNVRYMGEMFLNCSSLTTLDIRSFEFNFRPTGVSQMFSYCYNLETIYCNVDLTDMYEGNATYMFFGCEKLKGGNGTRYDADHINNSYARPDKPGQPGYFTELIDPCAVPQDVRLAGEVTREDMIWLAWTPGKEGQTGWGFRYKKSSERTYTEYYSRAINSGSSNYSIQIWGLEPGTEYDFVVFAICGEDILSDEDISADSEPFTASTLSPEAIESIHSSDISNQKMLRDGQLFIESNGKIYNFTGAQVK